MANFHIVTICVSFTAFLAATFAGLLYIVQDGNLKHKHLGVLFSRLPDLSFLDRLNYKAIGFGFPILTLAIISGFLWSKDARGSYWSWNPREIYSAALWLLYAVILHVRLSSKLRGRKVALLSIVAFFVIILTIFGSCGGFLKE